MRLPDWTGRPQIHAAGCFLAVLVAIAVVAFAIGTLEYTKTRGKLLLTALLVAGFFLTLVGATAMPRSGPGPWFRPAATGAASTALLLMVIGLWGTPDSNPFWKATAAVTVVAMGLVAVGQALSRAGQRQAAPVEGRYEKAARTDAHRGIQALAVTSAALSALLTAMAVLGIVLSIGAVAYWWAFGMAAVGWVLAGAAGLAVGRWRRRGRSGR